MSPCADSGGSPRNGLVIFHKIGVSTVYDLSFGYPTFVGFHWMVVIGMGLSPWALCAHVAHCEISCHYIDTVPHEVDPICL